MPNLIVILFNHMYPVFYVGFHCMGCMWERVWRLKTLLKTIWISQEVSQEAFPRSELRTEHMTGMRKVITAGFCKYFAGKAFPRDTYETFRFAYFGISVTPWLHPHNIYPHYPHIVGLLFREKTLDITLES